MTVNYMMRVADLNAMGSEDVGHWLAQDSRHLIVLPDFAILETFRGNAVLNLRDNFRVLQHFPFQCLKMHANDHLRGLPTVGRVSEAIDWDFTENLRVLLLAMRDGQADFPTEFWRNNCDIANEKSEQISRNVTKNRKFYIGVAPQVRRSFASRDASGVPTFTRKGLNRVKHLAIDLARLLASQGQSKRAESPLDDLVNTFYFRYAASSVAIMVNRIANGSLDEIRDDVLRNDIIDGNIMACSTYVNGFFSHDGQTKKAYRILTESLLT